MSLFNCQDYFFYVSFFGTIFVFQSVECEYIQQVYHKWAHSSYSERVKISNHYFYVRCRFINGLGQLFKRKLKIRKKSFLRFYKTSEGCFIVNFNVKLSTCEVLLKRESVQFIKLHSIIINLKGDQPTYIYECIQNNHIQTITGFDLGQNICL